MKLLIVEDDEFKALDLIKSVSETGIPFDFDRAASVTSALRAISANRYDGVILDMSLPTFDLSGPGGGGSPQGQGGLEVLRLSRKLGASPPFIIATQYPDIEIDGRETPLDQAAIRLNSQFGMRILGCLLYQFDGIAWKSALKRYIAALTTETK